VITYTAPTASTQAGMFIPTVSAPHVQDSDGH
jgi:hypothetical protein